MISSVSRIPAVSIILRTTPSMLILPSTISRVVPAIFVTIALSSRSRAFNKLLLPTLGRPIITVLIPSLTNLIFLESSRILFILVNRLALRGNNEEAVNSSTSSYSG